MINSEVSIVHNGTNWVRKTEVYTFDPHLRIDPPVERIAGQKYSAAPWAVDPGPNTPLVILSKPRPGYTDDARQNNVEGNVILRVTFEANGTIGAIAVVKGLELGLTEMTEQAARKIEFRPALENGIPVAVTKQLEYHFSIYCAPLVGFIVASSLSRWL